MDEKPKEPIKITDRRKFTLEGELRGTEPPQPEAPEPGSSQPSSPVRGEGFEMHPGRDKGAQRQQAGVDFNSFILSLSSTAFIHLGELADPVTGQIKVSLEAARQMIDIIDMLRDRTRGNLRPEEDELLSGVLYELKMKYAQKAPQR